MGDTAVHVTDVGGGAPIRTRQRSIGGITYDEQVVLHEDFDVVSGLYVCHVGSFTVGASAHAATAGFWWLLNTSASAMLRVLRVQMNAEPTAASAFVSAPRITLERMSFTGTPSGAAVTPGKRVRTAQNGYAVDGSALGSVRTASTGLTITAGEQEHAFSVPAVMTAVGFAAPYDQVWPLDDLGQGSPPGALYLASGEGIVLRQPDAGSTSDTRALRFSVAWEEVTLP